MRHRRLFVTGLVVGVVVWIVAPVVAVAVLLTASDRQSIVSAEEQAWVSVEPASASTTRTAAVQLLWEPSTVLRAPAWSGMIVRVLLEPGMPLTSGTSVVDIDGISRRAYATDAPFFRSLAVGDEGSDVRALNGILASFGAPEESDRFGWSTLRALRAFAAEIGVPRADEVTAFDPGWVIHLPASGAVTVGSVDLVAGERAPDQGAEIALGATALTAGRLVGTATEESAEHLSRAEYATATDQLAITPEQGETVSYRGTLLTVVDGGWLAAGDLEILRADLTGQPASIPVVLERPSSSDEFALPASAVSAGTVSEVCSRDDEDQPRVIEVEVVAGSSGEVTVRAPALAADAEVRIPSPSVAPCE